MAATHVRLNYYPDGGVARLRIYGTLDASSYSGGMTTSTMVPKQPLYMPMTTCSICTVIPYNDDTNDPNNIDTNVDDYTNLVRSSDDSNNNIVEISSCIHGGKGVYCSNQHYGTPDQLLVVSSGLDMSDGWETARQQLRPKILQPLLLLLPESKTVTVPSTHVDSSSSNHSTIGTDSNELNGSLVDFGSLMEYCILELGYPISFVQRIVIDTKHFKGNFPESIELSGCSIVADTSNSTASATLTTIDWANDMFSDDGNHSKTIQWYPIIDRCRLSPHAVHVFDVNQIQLNNSLSTGHRKLDRSSTTHDAAAAAAAAVSNIIISHVRVRIFPDGGLSRVRIYTQQ